MRGSIQPRARERWQGPGRVNVCCSRLSRPFPDAHASYLRCAAPLYNQVFDQWNISTLPALARASGTYEQLVAVRFFESP